MALKNALAMAAGTALLVSSPEARTEKSVGQDLQYDSESSVDGSTNRGEKGDCMIARPDSLTPTPNSASSSRNTTGGKVQQTAARANFSWSDN